MMLTISLLRYRVHPLHPTVHPLKPPISLRKLIAVCGLVYLVGLIAGCGIGLPLCFIKSNFVNVAYKKIFLFILGFLWLFRSNNIHGCNLL